MKQFLDFIPLVLFFGAYKFYDIYVATGVLMAATVLQMATIYAIDKELKTMHKVTLALILVFGTLTLVLHDERFIKWKPTVLYTATAIGLAVAVWGFKKNVLKLMIGAHLELPDAVWHKLCGLWIGYALFMAALNGAVAYYFSTDAWVNFKIWGYVFPIAFLVGQGLYLTPYLKEQAGQDKESQPKDTPHD